MKVWMRRRSAGCSASAARSMSPLAARARPHTTDFFRSLATSCTAAKSPSEAMGKPASITSTPMASRTSATRSFSGTVIEQPGDCSPSRKVVSKMITRSGGAAGGFVWSELVVIGGTHAAGEGDRTKADP